MEQLRGHTARHEKGDEYEPVERVRDGETAVRRHKPDVEDEKRRDADRQTERPSAARCRPKHHQQQHEGDVRLLKNRTVRE